MNILIDMRPFYTPEMNRGNMYSEDLLRALFRNHPNDIFYLWTTGKKRPKGLPAFEKYSHVKYVHTKISKSRLAFWVESFSYPYIDDIVETQAMKDGQMAWISQVDAAIFPCPAKVPIERNCLKVYISESLAPFHYPDAYTGDTANFHAKKRYSQALDTADLIITPSKFMKADLISSFSNAPEEKITVIGAGVLEAFEKEDSQVEEKNVLEKELFLQHEEEEKEDITEKLPENFFFVRGVESHFGNFSPLLQAYELFQSRFGEDAWQMVIEESIEGDLDQVSSEDEQKLPKNILILPPLEPEERVAVLQKSKCFVYPSLYDGDAVALIEAMRQKCPVLSSNFSALPETFLQTAIDFDPTSFVSVLRALKKIFRDQDLQKSLPKIAEERSLHTRFRWDDIAEHMMRRIAERIEEKVEEDDE